MAYELYGAVSLPQLHWCRMFWVSVLAQHGNTPDCHVWGSVPGADQLQMAWGIIVLSWTLLGENYALSSFSSHYLGLEYGGSHSDCERLAVGWAYVAAEPTLGSEDLIVDHILLTLANVLLRAVLQNWKFDPLALSLIPGGRAQQYSALLGLPCFDSHEDCSHSSSPHEFSVVHVS